MTWASLFQEGERLGQSGLIQPSDPTTLLGSGAYTFTSQSEAYQDITWVNHGRFGASAFLREDINNDQNDILFSTWITSPQFGIDAVLNDTPIGPNEELGDIHLSAVRIGDIPDPSPGNDPVTPGNDPASVTVPEPSLLLGLLAFGFLGAGSVLKRKKS